MLFVSSPETCNAAVYNMLNVRRDIGRPRDREGLLHVLACSVRVRVDIFMLSMNSKSPGDRQVQRSMTIMSCGAICSGGIRWADSQTPKMEVSFANVVPHTFDKIIFLRP